MFLISIKLVDGKIVGFKVWWCVTLFDEWLLQWGLEVSFLIILVFGLLVVEVEVKVKVVVGLWFEVKGLVVVVVDGLISGLVNGVEV